MANKVLGIVFLLFVLSIIVKYFYGELFVSKLFFYVMEAALVGGIADWFAVSALFKKPLGFPYHTELIPRKRDEIIRSVANMVETELLTPEMIKEKLDKIHFVEHIIKWVDKSDGNQKFGKLILEYSSDILAKIDTKKLAKYGENILKDYAKNLEITPIIYSFSQQAIQKGQFDQWLDHVLEELQSIVEKEETKIKIEKILLNAKEEKTSGSFRGIKKGIANLLEKTNALNIPEGAKAIHNELIDTMNNLKDPNYHFRIKINEMISETVENLKENESVIISLENWKKGVIERTDLHGLLEYLIQSIIDIVKKSTDETPENLSSKQLNIVSSNNPSFIVEWMNEQISKYWVIFKRNKVMKNKVDLYLKEITIRLIEKEYKLIGNIVVDALTLFTNEGLNNFIEDKVGGDLQWIRINGSFVGGALGFIIFMFVNFIYDPIIQVFLN
jgi:uncharacterized membrane-anchored protein YjiN (DUF445 family)